MLLLSALPLCFVLAGCMGSKPAQVGEDAEAAPSKEAVYHALTAEEAKARMDSGDALTVLDVRTEAEYNEAHIPGAMLLPNETIGEAMPAELPELDAEILVYCRSGNRSKQAADKLVALGYTAVYDFGGIKDWPYETVAE